MTRIRGTQQRRRQRQEYDRQDQATGFYEEARWQAVLMPMSHNRDLGVAL